MLSWGDELNQMLIAFERQAKLSLDKIELIFERDGFSFDDKFKKHFMRVSYSRVEETYDQFYLNYLMKNHGGVGGDAMTSTSDDFQMMDFNETTQQEISDSIEIIESSDEVDGPEYRMKSESLLERVAIQGHDTPYELNQVENVDSDGSSTEFDNTMKANEIEERDGLPTNTISGRTNERTSTVTVKKGLSVDGRGKVRNMTCKNPTKEDSISRNQLAMKKRFKCELCPYSSNIKSNFTHHISTHTVEKPYRCDICHKEFTHSRDMKRHKVTHTNEISFHCRGCLTGFLQKEEREVHEKVCKYRRYECHLCKKYVTDRKSNFIQHMLVHSGEKPFRCEICMMGFTQKCNLKRHLNIIHTRINP